jgi:hypothetical protein
MLKYNLSESSLTKNLVPEDYKKPSFVPNIEKTDEPADVYNQKVSDDSTNIEAGLTGEPIGNGLFSRIKPSEQRISNKYFLDTDKLNNGILELRYNKNRHLTNIKSQVIGNGIKGMLQDVIFNGKLDESQYPVLTPYEQNLISTILNMIGKRDLLGDTNGQFQERFQIILGEWGAGNNSDHLRNELKQYIMHAMKINLISRTLGQNMLIEMTT